MGNQITIDKTSVLEAYKQASEEQKKIMEDLFGEDVSFPKDITDRIKTFQDACDELGEEDDLVAEYKSLIIGTTNFSDDLIAYLQLRIIAKALNDGWEPTFGKEEYRYSPWFFIYNKEEYEKLNEDEKKKLCAFLRSHAGSYAYCGVIYAYSVSDSPYTYSSYGSRLVFKTKSLAEYCGKQFIDIWADYLFP